jgi:hypothetical protein
MDWNLCSGLTQTYLYNVASQFVKNFHLSGEEETPIYRVIKALQKLPMFGHLNVLQMNASSS